MCLVIFAATLATGALFFFPDFEKANNVKSMAFWGLSAGTTRGFGGVEFRCIGELILTVIDALAVAGPQGNPSVEEKVLELREHCRRACHVV